ncbi:MAG: nitroreductase family protein [Candidatus Heimdallarchaeota archaeon]|nr:nitroreductase family protein [Candidatus Heimdallarchaeota archaeon]MCK5143215.1 nitroreductase family protein [Candidatus Heimdallarchaeota archaeon]
MELKQVIEERQAFRALEPVEITDDFVKDIAYQASRTPSCGNKQPWRFVFVKDKTVLSELHEALSGGNYWAKEASMIIAIHSHPDMGCLIGPREYYLFGTGMATAHLMLSIVDKGLVAHAMAGFKEGLAKEILKIPEEHRLIALLAVGKRSDDLSKLGEKHQEDEITRSSRNPFEEYAHIDRYE